MSAPTTMYDRRGEMERLSRLAQRLGVRLRGTDAMFSRVITDTRQLRPGDLYVALRGANFDGHEFVRRAASLGAVGALVERAIDCELPQVVVTDTLAALQDYARDWRLGFEIPVVAVTGSNGKTTTKQLLAALFEQRGPVLATQGNLNNHIGLPLTLLRLRAEHRTAVIEMGANHPGEIARLTAIARPHVGVVTQAGDAHLEGFGSRYGVAQAKGELFQGLGEQGVAVINADDPYAPLWRQLAEPASIVRFGFSDLADVRAADVETLAGGQRMRFTLITPESRADVELPLPGRHNVANALAAAACGVALGMAAEEIAAGLARVRQVAGRVTWTETANGARLIDDSYNANPTSLRAGLELLAAQPGQRWAVLGDMAELGTEASQMHRDAGRIARQLGIDRLYATGSMAQHYAEGYGEGARVYEVMESLSSALQADLGPAVTLLVKGSRSAGMDRVVEALGGAGEAGGH